LTGGPQFDTYRTVSTSTHSRRQLSADQFARISKALADPRRMELLEAMARHTESPCVDLRKDCPLSKATVSHHVKELVRAGLIDAHRDGQYLRCHVRQDVLDSYTQELKRRLGA
jgi:ArsR family transcriptional regulator